MASPPPPSAVFPAPSEPLEDRPRLSPSRSPVKAQTIDLNFESAREGRRELVWTERHNNRAAHALRNRRKSETPSGAVPAAAAGRSSPPRAVQEKPASGRGRRTLGAESVEPINEKDNDRAVALAALNEVRAVISDRPASLSARLAVDAQLLAPLVGLLGDFSDHEKQGHAASILQSLLGGESAAVMACVQAGALPALLRVLSHTDVATAIAAVRCVASIASESDECRTLALQVGVVTPIAALLNGPPGGRALPADAMQAASHALCVLCSTHQAPLEWLQPAMPHLSRLVYAADDDTLAHTAEALAAITTGGLPERVQCVVQLGVCRRLVELMMHTSFRVQLACLNVLTNVASVADDGATTAILINLSIVPVLHCLLSSPKERARRQACVALRHLLNGRSAHLRHAIDSNVFPVIMQLCNVGRRRFDDPVRTEACKLLGAALAVGSEEELGYLLSLDCLPTLCDMLRHADKQVILAGLRGLRAVYEARMRNERTLAKLRDQLTVCDAITALEALQMHSDLSVYEEAVALIELLPEPEELTAEKLP